LGARKTKKGVRSSSAKIYFKEETLVTAKNGNDCGEKEKQKMDRPGKKQKNSDEFTWKVSQEAYF